MSESELQGKALSELFGETSLQAELLENRFQAPSRVKL